MLLGPSMSDVELPEAKFQRVLGTFGVLLEVLLRGEKWHVFIEPLHFCGGRCGTAMAVFIVFAFVGHVLVMSLITGIVIEQMFLSKSILDNVKECGKLLAG